MGASNVTQPSRRHTAVHSETALGQIAPRMLTPGRLSGILLPLFSLRSRSDFGIGDFGGLEGLFQWMKAARQKMLMLLPLLPTAPGDSSPYSTRSAFGLNPLFIDLQALPEFHEGGGLQALSDDERKKLEEARTSHRIRYDLVFPLKNAALNRAFNLFEERHWKTGSSRAQELTAYVKEQASWLDSFALFMAASHDQGYRAWWEWPEGLRNRHPLALDETRSRLSREIRYQSWLQWVAETQCPSRGSPPLRRRALHHQSRQLRHLGQSPPASAGCSARCASR
jgi:4-alpha-glucanotransferase